MNEKFKKTIPYIIASAGFILTVFLTVIIFDLLVIPSLIKGKDTVSVPDLTGKSLSLAEKSLSELGLKVGTIVQQYNEKYSEGTVFNQSPKAGSEVKSGRTIYLTVSKGKELVRVPYLIGQGLRTARISLSNLGLEIGQVSYDFNDTFGVDTVIIQSIPSGREIQYGSMIDLIVSKGPENQIKVPSLIGMTYEDAQNLIIETGLIVGGVSYQQHETYLPNTVVSQNPAPGTLLPAEGKITLVVSK